MILGKYIPAEISNLVEEFNRLPGIGQKTAVRLALHILNISNEAAESLAHTILKVKKEIKFCQKCFNYSTETLCNICADSSRDHSQICVVEDAPAILMIEKTNEFKGLYHVLGGIISPLDGINPEDLRIRELLDRIESVSEIIIALNPSTEGEATSIYLSKILKPLDIKITRLARGIPLGSTLEFVDELTLGKALKTRGEL